MDGANILSTVIQPVASTPAAAPSSAADRYVLGDEIAHGGMGVVFQATDTTLGRKVAVKVLQNRYAADAGAARRFTDEARITGLLQHPNVPAVHDFGTLSDGRPYLAMKLIKGESLDNLLKARPGPAADRGRFVAAFEQVCQAVAYAHTHRVMHRDLKPSNVMVGAFGEVQVMDWGLAKVLPTTDEHADSPVNSDATAVYLPQSEVCVPHSDGTQAGSIIGTPAFMPPEQAAGAIASIDLRSDVFGLGGILAAILTGQPPYTAESAETARVKAATGDVADCFARLDDSDADPELVALCKQCLSPRPIDRPADAGVVAAAVARLRVTADERAQKAERDKLSAEVRRRATLWAAGAVAAVLLLGIAGTTAGLFRANVARREAETARTEAQTKRAEADAALTFIENRVFVAARPKGWDGGAGANLTLRETIAACLPHLANDFRGQPRAEARLRHTLGTTLVYLDDTPEATRQLEAALALFTTHLGADHPDTLACANNLALTYAVAGRNADAIRLTQQVLDARQRSLALDDPLLLTTQYNLATTLLRAGRHTEALNLFERNLPAQRQVLGPDHPDTLNSMTNLGASYILAGQRPKGEAHLAKTLAAQRRVAPNHPLTLRTAFVLAASYAEGGRHADALPLRREVLAGYRTMLPPNHKDTLLAVSALAESLYWTGNITEAIPLIDECVAQATGRVIDSDLVPGVINLRLRIARDRKDAAGARMAAEQYEKHGRTDSESLYDAACCRAVTAGLLTDDAAAAKAEADRAMVWLTRAVAAGYKNRAHMEKDSDLDALREREDFRQLLESLPASEQR
jgi:serine/threonine protein kinase/tetratricopeptide (TPR) repeat protein